MTPLLDTHQHLIVRDRFGYAWADAIPALAARDFGPADYLALAAEAGIADAIFMETAVDARREADEAAYAQALIGTPGSLTRGVVAGCHPETDEGFDALLAATAGPQYVGYRRILHVVDDGVSQTDTFRANVRKIGARGKVYELCFLQRQLGIAHDLAAACDNTRMVLDHCGVPDIAGGDFDGWRRDIDRLAALPHVACKVSGVTAYCGPDQNPETAVRRYVDHAVAAFGWDRVVWGGDWPVVDVRVGLPAWAAITRRIFAGADEADRTKLFHANARRIYGLAAAAGRAAR